MSEADAPAAIGPKAYADWRATRLGAITEALEQALILDVMGELAGRDVLDVGCGDGALLCAAAARGAGVTGVDPDPAMLAAARKRAAEAGVDAALQQARAERLPFPDASFDVVAAITVLCFVGDAASAIQEMARVLRPGGRMVVGELGRWSLWALIRRVRGWLRSRTWATARFRTAGELTFLVESASVSIRRIRGAIYYPPMGAATRILAPADPWLGRLGTFGAAFIAVAGTRRAGR